MKGLELLLGVFFFLTCLNLRKSLRCRAGEAEPDAKGKAPLDERNQDGILDFYILWTLFSLYNFICTTCRSLREGETAGFKICGINNKIK